ncbi:NF-kappa-B inhibitor zeta [Melanotaenia boesemani]|uniref:NF-kappa-B inhibitor zeta n=1 Tax=Melanotaenia boesemani TaxID=1250792 RepID=UPI001C04D61D|nr:NF-kappa-B inhibitor zeta [Melanotaenia boesemani]
MRADNLCYPPNFPQAGVCGRRKSLEDLVNMLDQKGNESRGHVLSSVTNFVYSNEDDFMADSKTPGFFQAVQKKITVKDLLRLRCQTGILEPKLKRAKTEDFAPEMSPHLSNLPAPGHPNTPAGFSSAAENMVLQQIQDMLQQPPLQQQNSPTSEVKMTLFHWQIQQEVQNVGGLSAELLNKQDSDGDTFLHIAVAQGRRALAYVLAAKMARCGSLEMKEHNGQTALQIAAASNQHLIVYDLLTHGAQISTRDLWGRSPLHVCAEKGHFQSLQSICRALTGTDQQPDIEIFNYEGLTPLHAAVMSHNAVVKEMRCLENPCSYMMMEFTQKKLMYVECIKTLMHMGASCGTKDLKSGRTCLHMAAEEGNLELLHIFLDKSTSLAVVNIKTFSGNTALHIVSSLQNHKTQVEAVKLLMRKGADPGTRNFENELPCQLVSEGPIGEKVRQILKGKCFCA